MIIGTYEIAKVMAVKGDELHTFTKDEMFAFLTQQKESGAVDDDEIAENMRVFDARIEFTPDGQILTLMKAPDGVIEKPIGRSKTDRKKMAVDENGRWAKTEWKVLKEYPDRTLLDVIIEGRASDPEEMIIHRENLGSIHSKINEVLSGLEQDVLNAYLDGKSYQEIAESLGRHVKSIDNALQRVKRKLEKYLEETTVRD